MNLPRISVITPTSDDPYRLEQTICSILDQGYPNLELIVVDRDGSDTTADVIRLYRDQLIQHAESGTIGHCVNSALRRASGQWMTVVLGHNILLPGALDAMAAHEQAGGSTGWYAGSAIRINGHDDTVGPVRAQVPHTLASFLMRDSGLLPEVGVFVHRELLDRAGWFDENLLYAWDYDYWCRLLQRGVRPVVAAQTLGLQREPLASLSAARALQEGLEYIQIAERYASCLPMRDRCPLWVNCDRRRRIYMLAQAELDVDEARAFVLAQVMRRPWWLANPAVLNRMVKGVEHAAPHDLAA